MIDTHDGFEGTLREAFLANDFAAWDRRRAVYADWLQERNAALMPMAMARFSCLIQPHRILGWRWFLDTAVLDFRHRPWLSSRRTNCHALLGFPPTSLRCMEVIPRDREDDWLLRFEVRLCPRHSEEKLNSLPPLASVRQLRAAGIYETFDTTVHPCGYPALFWPSGWEPSDWSLAPRGVVGMWEDH